MNSAVADFVHALGWSLVHFMWQGLLVGAAAAVALSLLREARPQARYAVSCAGLLLCLLVPAAGVWSSLGEGSSTAAPQATESRTTGNMAVEPAPVPFGSWKASLQNGLPAIVAVWSIVAGMLALRMALGIRWVSRVARSSSAVADPAWQMRLDRLARAFGIRRAIALRVVTEFDSPVAAGVWRPMVMIPAALVTRMPVEMLEALLAHELSHIRRHDYLVNLIQSAVESLLFYHPVVWWLSRRIRIEREQIADALAAGVLGEPRRLAVALHGLAEFQFDAAAISRASFAAHANGGNLMSRIQRLIRPDHHTATWKVALSLFVATLAGLGVTAACLTAYASDLQPGMAGTVVDVKAPAVVKAATLFATGIVEKTRAADARRNEEKTSCLYCDFRKDGSDGFAIVTGGEEITMSASTRDVFEIKALRGRIGGDFIWVRRDGKTYVIQDPAIIAKATEAWKPANAMAARMDAVSDRMEAPSAEMEELGRKMEAIAEAWRPNESEMERVSAEMESLAAKHEKVAERMAKTAEELARGFRAQEGELDRNLEALEVEMERLQVEMEPLQEEMEKLGAVMEKESAEMERAMAPMEELGRQMEEASRPMEALGEEMSALGQQMEALSHEANRRTMSLIDEALRSGKAVPTTDGDLDF